MPTLLRAAGLFVLLGCNRSTPSDAPAVASSSAAPAAPTVAPAASVASKPAASGLPFVSDPADESSPITGTHDVDAVAKMIATQPAYRSRRVTVRAFYVKSGKEDGFPQVYFTNVPANAGETLPSQRVLTCQYDLDPGESGPTFPKNAPIVLEGVLSPKGDRDDAPFFLSDCKAKKAP